LIFIIRTFFLGFAPAHVTLYHHLNHWRPSDGQLVTITWKTAFFCWEDEAIHATRAFSQRSSQTTAIGPTIRLTSFRFDSQRSRHHVAPAPVESGM
jgi:hypothetical protein